MANVTYQTNTKKPPVHFNGMQNNSTARQSAGAPLPGKNVLEVQANKRLHSDVVGGQQVVDAYKRMKVNPEVEAVMQNSNSTRD